MFHFKMIATFKYLKLFSYFFSRPAHLQDTSDPMVRFPVVTFSSPRCIHATVTLWDPSKDFRSISNNFSYLDASGKILI